MADSAIMNTWHHLGRRIIDGFNLKCNSVNALDIKDGLSIPFREVETEIEGKLRRKMLSNLEFIAFPENEDAKGRFKNEWWNTEYSDRVMDLGDFAISFIEAGLIEEYLPISGDDEESKRRAMTSWLVHELGMSEGEFACIPGVESEDYQLLSDELFMRSENITQARTALQIAQYEDVGWRNWSTGRIIQEKKGDCFRILEKWTSIEKDFKDAWTICMRAYWNQKDKVNCLRIGELAQEKFHDDEWINKVVNNCRAAIQDL